MFLETFKGDSRELQGYLKEVQRGGGFKRVSRQFQKCFTKVSRVESVEGFQENWGSNWLISNGMRT